MYLYATLKPLKWTDEQTSEEILRGGACFDVAFIAPVKTLLCNLIRGFSLNAEQRGYHCLHFLPQPCGVILRLIWEASEAGEVSLQLLVASLKQGVRWGSDSAGGRLPLQCFLTHILRNDRRLGKSQWNLANQGQEVQPQFAQKELSWTVFCLPTMRCKMSLSRDHQPWLLLNNLVQVACRNGEVLGVFTSVMAVGSSRPLVYHEEVGKPLWTSTVLPVPWPALSLYFPFNCKRDHVLTVFIFSC